MRTIQVTRSGWLPLLALPTLIAKNEITLRMISQCDPGVGCGSVASSVEAAAMTAVIYGQAAAQRARREVWSTANSFLWA